MELIFKRNQADFISINAHLVACDNQYIPPLSERADLATYGAKLAENAECFEAWYGDRLIGLVAAYAHAPDQQCIFVTNVSVAPDMQGQGVATRLLSTLIDYARDAAFAWVALKVDSRNDRAVKLYRSLRFRSTVVDGNEVQMTLNLRA